VKGVRPGVAGELVTTCSGVVVVAAVAVVNIAEEDVVDVSTAGGVADRGGVVERGGVPVVMGTIGGVDGAETLSG